VLENSVHFLLASLRKNFLLLTFSKFLEIEFKSLELALEGFNFLHLDRVGNGLALICQFVSEPGDLNLETFVFVIEILEILNDHLILCI